MMNFAYSCLQSGCLEAMKMKASSYKFSSCLSTISVQNMNNQKVWKSIHQMNLKTIGAWRMSKCVQLTYECSFFASCITRTQNCLRTIVLSTIVPNRISLSSNPVSLVDNYLDRALCQRCYQSCTDLSARKTSRSSTLQCAHSALTLPFLRSTQGRSR